MMMGFAVIIAANLFMAWAFLFLLGSGFKAGEAGPDQKLGFGALAVCITLMLTQAALWAGWGHYLGGVA